MAETNFLLSRKEVAKRLGVKYQTIVEWNRRGYLKAIKINNYSVRIPESEVIRIQSHYKTLEEKDYEKNNPQPENNSESTETPANPEQLPVKFV